MSFFGGDTKIYVSSVIYQLGNELNEIPDVVKASIIGSGMKNTSRSYAIKKSILDGLGLKLQQGYAYAAKSYYAGLPRGIPQILGEPGNVVIETLVTEYLTTFHAPTAINLRSVNVVLSGKSEMVVRNLIEAEYNYDFYEDKVHTSVYGLPVGSVLEYNTLAPDDLLHPNEGGWRLTFTKPDTTVVTFDEWYADGLFPATDLVENRIFYEVSLAGAPAVTGCYSYGDGYTPLDLFLRGLRGYTRTTFPAIVLKKKNIYLDDNLFHVGGVGQPAEWWKTQPAYRTSKVYARRMAVEMQDLLDLIKENPDEKKIDYAFIQPGTIISSPNLSVHEYHFNYFNRLRLINPDNKPAFDAWLAKVGSVVSKTEAQRAPSQSINIYDPETTTSTVNMTIAWRYMTYEVKSGTIAAKYTVECGAKTPQDANYTIGGGAIKKAQYQFTPVTWRKRLTESTYAELVVVGLWHENYVYKGKTVKSAVWDAFNDPDGDYGTGFLIPLDYEIYMSLSGRERLQLAQEAQHVVFNCYKVVKEKWYQTGLFKVVLLIVAVVVIVITWGSAAPYVSALSAGINTSLIALGISVTVAAALATIIAALIVVGALVAVNLVAKAAGEWAAEQWGPVWGAIVQVVVTIALTWGLGQLGQNYLDVSVTAMTLTQQVMSAASLVFSTLSTYTQFEMEQIQEEWSKWNAGADDRQSQMKQLEELWEENFPEMKLPAQMWFAPMERPEDWLIRTQSTGDALVNRLIAPVEYMSEITLTPRLQ